MIMMMMIIYFALLCKKNSVKPINYTRGVLFLVVGVVALDF